MTKRSCGDEHALRPYSNSGSCELKRVVLRPLAHARGYANQPQTFRSFAHSLTPMFCDHLNVGMTRRDFFGKFALGLGGIALSQLLPRSLGAADGALNPLGGVLPAPHFPVRAKRIIYLFMAGGPSQLDLFDYKPLLNERNSEDLPESVRQGQRLTGMSANQAKLPMAGSVFKFARHGANGAWVSDLLPWTAKM